MKPPVCAACGRDFDPTEEGGLVRVGPRKEPWWNGLVDPEEVERHGPPTGHPPDEAWFCGEHVAEARRRAGRPREEGAAGEVEDGRDEGEPGGR